MCLQRFPGSAGLHCPGNSVAVVRTVPVPLFWGKSIACAQLEEKATGCRCSTRDDGIVLLTEPHRTQGGGGTSVGWRRRCPMNRCCDLWRENSLRDHGRLHQPGARCGESPFPRRAVASRPSTGGASPPRCVFHSSAPSAGGTLSCGSCVGVGYGSPLGSLPGPVPMAGVEISGWAPLAGRAVSAVQSGCHPALPVSAFSRGGVSCLAAEWAQRGPGGTHRGRVRFGQSVSRVPSSSCSTRPIGVVFLQLSTDSSGKHNFTESGSARLYKRPR